MTKYIVAFVLVGLLAATGGYFAKDYFAPPKPKLQTLDINKVVNVNETILASRDLTPEALTTEAKLFVLRLQDGISKLQTECDCVLLVSSAVISPSKLPDRTADLLLSLGFSEREMARAEAILESRMKKLEPNP